MRLPRRAALAAVSVAALLANSGAAAIASAGEPGGAAAPVSAATGAVQYGVPASVARPQLAALHVPGSSTAGRPPRITLELTEQHVSRVFLRVLLVDLSTRRTAVTATMNWVPTGRLLAVVWPKGASLAAGTYRVTVSAHDSRNGNILRTARISGEATLVVRPAPAAAPEPEQAGAGAPTIAQTIADGAVFPVQGAHSFGGPENRFGAPREGHIHQGQDILAAEGTPDVVPLAGTIEQTSYQAGGAGYYVVEHTAYGLDFMFAHCEADSFAVGAGDSVAAGQQICRAGQTGDATAPHLHFEMWVGRWQTAGGRPIDPLPYLQAWERAGAS